MPAGIIAVFVVVALALLISLTSAVIAWLDALKRGAIPALLALFVPGYLLFHLAARSRSRARWWLLAGLFVGVVLLVLLAAFIIFAEKAPVQPLELAI